MKRAERGLEKILDRERRAPAGAGGAIGSGDAPSAAARASDAVGVSVPVGSESGSHLQAVREAATIRTTDKEKVWGFSIAGGASVRTTPYAEQ